MSKTDTFDLATLDTIAACNRPFDVEILHPVTKEQLGLFFTVVGKDSDIYRSQIKAMANESLVRDATARPGKPNIQNIDKLEAKNINALVAATTGWWRFADVRKREGRIETMTLDGEELPFSPANARTVYTRILPAREQVLEGLNDLENYLGN